MKTYVIQRDGDEVGVFTKRQLKQGIRSGGVKASDEMRQTGTKEWYRVGSVSKLFEHLKEGDDTQEPQLNPSDDSYIMNPDSADQTGFGDEVVDPAASSVDVETDELDDLDSTDDSMDEDPSSIDPDQARSDLKRATVFATQNFLRRSIFINNADSIQKYGIILQLVGVVVLAIYTYLIHKNSSVDPFLRAGAYAAAIIVGTVAAAKCRHAGQRLVASTPTSVRGPQPLDMLGLMILTAGLAILTGAILSAFLLQETELKVWTILYGVLGLLATVLASGLVLSPSITNVEIQTVTATEEAFGLVALVAKAGLLLSPFVLACCSAVGVLQGIIATYYVWQGGQGVVMNMSGWTWPLVILLIAGFYPLMMYFVLLVYSMFERMFR
jgi:hypothetical protein